MSRKPDMTHDTKEPKLSLVERRERKIAELNAKNEQAKQLVRVREQIDTLKMMVSAKDYNSAIDCAGGLIDLLKPLAPTIAQSDAGQPRVKP